MPEMTSVAELLLIRSEKALTPSSCSSKNLCQKEVRQIKVTCLWVVPRKGEKKQGEKVKVEEPTVIDVSQEESKEGKSTVLV